MTDDNDVDVLEQRRLEALHDYKIIDSAPEVAFDRLTRLTADIFDVPMAAITLIDAKRQWFKSAVGLDITETPRNIAFCNQIIASGSTLLVQDAEQDERFNCNPLVTGPPNLRYYIGCPLVTSNNLILGTLWIGDTKSRPLPSDDELERLHSIADIVMSEMVLRREVEKRRLAQQQAAQARMDLELALALSSTASWSLNLTTDRISWGGAYFKVWGEDTDEALLTSKDAFERIHPDDRDRVQTAVDSASELESDGYNETFRIILPNGEIRWLLGRGNFVRNLDHDAITGVNYDITDSVQQEEQQKLHTRELHHRLRNLFATLQSIMTLTKNSASSIDDYIERIEGRLSALNRAQQILLDTNFVTGSFAALVNDLCQTYPKMKWTGPDITLPENAMVAISLVLNEMATNAAKYGALSQEGGKVEIAWAMEKQDGEPPLIALEWTESGGPAVHGGPTQHGFGSSLIDHSVKNNLKGVINRQWLSNGLACTVSFPLTESDI